MSKENALEFVNQLIEKKNIQLDNYDRKQVDEIYSDLEKGFIEESDKAIEKLKDIKALRFELDWAEVKKNITEEMNK